MSVKKVASGRRSARVEDPDSTQSATERRAAESELRAMIAEFAPEHLRLIDAVRKSLRKHLSAAHEVVYEYANQGAVVISFSPNEHGYNGLLAIRASADGVKLYFNQGKDLPDPEKLLQGSANARWIEVEGASTLTRPAVARLLDDALARNRVPFADGGRGSVVIRSTTVKKKSHPKVSS